MPRTNTTSLSDSPATEPVRLHTVQEAGQLLRVSRWGVYQLIQRRELRSITIGGRRLVTAPDLAAYIEARRQDDER